MLRTRLALLGAAALLAACGDDRSAQEVARGYVASDDPEKCDDVSQAFLERQTRRRGDAARSACERAVKRFRPPSGVSVTSASERGDRAEVRLEASGQDVLVRLERRGDRWLVVGLGS